VEEPLSLFFFPHYFNPTELHGTLSWSGSLPEYRFFEPKRTSLAEYNELVEVFKNKPLKFIEVHG